MKLKEFQHELAHKGVDHALFINYPERNDPNFTYFTGLSTIFGILTIPARGTSTLYCSPIEEYIAEQYSTIRKIVGLKKSAFDAIKEHVRGTLGIDKRYISIKGYSTLKKNLQPKKIVDVGPIIDPLRVTKTEEEQAHLTKAAKIICDVMHDTIAFASSSVTEHQVLRFVENMIRDRGYEQSFNTIVASKGNASSPHYIPGYTKLKGFTVLDMGVKYKNYCSDLTRTIYVGTPNAKEKEIYEEVLKVQEDCIAMIHEGMKCSEPDEYARKKLGAPFNHALGHGIGVQVHENPVINAKSHDTFKKNMAFTIEPGYYIKKKYGIRIEDDLLMKEKPRVITRITKELITKH